MTGVLFDYPQNAAFGHVLPKNKIYQHASPSHAVKELFVRQVEQIVWQYKLAPETINLKSSRAVPEIQIFYISLKTGELKHDVLSCIDQSIPFPIIFEVGYEGKIQVVAAFKRPSDADSSKWVVSAYFESDWVDPKAVGFREELPVALDLESLYALMIERLILIKKRPFEALRELVERAETIKKLEREIGLTENKMIKEKQFNRKVSINAELRILKQEYEDLKR